MSAAGVATAAEHDAIAKHMHDASAGPISWKNCDTSAVLNASRRSCTLPDDVTMPPRNSRSCCEFPAVGPLSIVAAKCLGRSLTSRQIHRAKRIGAGPNI